MFLTVGAVVLAAGSVVFVDVVADVFDIDDGTVVVDVVEGAVFDVVELELALEGGVITVVCGCVTVFVAGLFV